MKKATAGNIFDVHLLKRILVYVKPYRKYFLFGASLTLLLALLSPVRPWLIQYTLDHYILEPNKHALLWMALLMVLVLIFESVFQFYQTYITNWLGQSVIKDLRVELYRHITGIRLTYFDKRAIGTLVTRVISDMETIAEIFSQGILVIMGDMTKLIAVIAMMFYTNWWLTVVSLSSFPFLIVATAIFKKFIKLNFQEVRVQVARLNAFVQEHITGMTIVQIFNKEEEEMEKFKEINEKHKKAHIRSVWINSIFFPVVEMLSAISLALLVWIGIKGVINEAITFGNLVAFILYIYMLFRPIRQLADRFNVLQMGMVSSERIFSILDTKEVIEDNGNINSNSIQGNIEFKNVWFAYNQNEWVLKDISFSVKQGETIALVGATGAGKSSVSNLLNRFYEYNKGSIEMDGVNIREYDLHFLRSHIAIVLQDVFLFSDSIFNNITLNNEKISREEVVRASKLVGADDFIQKFPKDYDYNVMERGNLLSVGQRQLIAFIRAYVSQPSILILDEATSSIDTETENLIRKATDIITKNRTSIIIAHRLSTIQNADRIIVLKNGEIVETGKHHELIQQDGHYKTLYELSYQNENTK